MNITSTTRTVLKNGTIKGTIRVSEKVRAPGHRNYTVHYEKLPNGHAEQWGAPTEVLLNTYQKFAELTSDLTEA